MHSIAAGFETKVEAVERPPESGIKLRGHFKLECFNADGSLAWVEEFHNMTVNAGVNSMLNVYFDSATQITSWFLGLIDGSSTPTLAAGDTLASHSGWTENTTYTGNRQAWTPGSASGGVITNGTAATFPITGSASIAGAFLCSAATGTSGTLFGTGLFNSTQSLTNGQNLKVTYTVTGTGS